MKYAEELGKKAKELGDKINVLFIEFYQENGDVEIEVIWLKKIYENKDKIKKLIKSSVELKLSMPIN